MPLILIQKHVQWLFGMLLIKTTYVCAKATIQTNKKLNYLQFYVHATYAYEISRGSFTYQGHSQLSMFNRGLGLANLPKLSARLGLVYQQWDLCILVPTNFNMYN